MSISEMFYNLGQALIDYIDRRISHVSSTESAIVVTRMNAHSLDTQVPSAKCVYDSLQNIDLTNYYTKEDTDDLLDNKADKDDVPSQCGVDIDLNLDSSTNTITAILRDKDSAIIGTGSVQIPVAEISGVTNGTYDSNTKIITFVLENGNRIEIPATDLVPLVTIREWS